MRLLLLALLATTLAVDATIARRFHGARVHLYAHGRGARSHAGGTSHGRGRNWCARYESKTISCAVLAGNTEHVRAETLRCPWGTHCPNRVMYRTYLAPTYKMGHKTVTALKWGCCPGYSGTDCRSKAGHQAGHQAHPDTAKRTKTGSIPNSQIHSGSSPDVLGKKIGKLEGEFTRLSGTVGRLESSLSGMADSLRAVLQEDTGRMIATLLGNKELGRSSLHSLPLKHGPGAVVLGADADEKAPWIGVESALHGLSEVRDALAEQTKALGGLHILLQGHSNRIVGLEAQVEKITPEHTLGHLTQDMQQCRCEKELHVLENTHQTEKDVLRKHAENLERKIHSSDVSVATAMALVHKHLERLEKNINSTNKSVMKHQDVLRGMQVDKRDEGFENRLRGDLDGMHVRFDAIASQLDERRGPVEETEKISIMHRLDVLEHKMSELEGRCTMSCITEPDNTRKLETRLDGYVQNCNAVAATASHNSKRLDAMNHTKLSRSRNPHKPDRELSRLDLLVSGHAARLASSEDRLFKLERDQGSTARQLSQKLNTTQTFLGGLRTDIDACCGRLSHVEGVCSKLDSIALGLRGIREDLGENVASLWRCVHQMNASKGIHCPQGQDDQTLNVAAHTQSSKLPLQLLSGSPRAQPSHCTVFAAVLTQFVSEQETIKFNKVLVNDGGHYDPESGIFQIPYDGRYLFLVTISPQRNRSIKATLSVSERRTVHINTWPGVPGASGSFPGVANIVLALRAGESVYVENHGGSVAYGEDQPLSSFTGALLYERQPTS
uniref:EMILIN-2-like isoform X1 n=2 Tax=Myxine glutinosa TaxID=7769 RepID=UPI00358FF55A